MLSAFVSLHRCEDAPIPAAPVSSLLPFDDQRIHIYIVFTHNRKHTHTHRLGERESEKKSPLYHVSLML